jgi:hypothetical protein
VETTTAMAAAAMSSPAATVAAASSAAATGRHRRRIKRGEHQNSGAEKPRRAQGGPAEMGSFICVAGHWDLL